MNPDVDCVGCSWPGHCPCYDTKEMPEPDALLGIDPDWTGGLPVDEYLGEVRGD